MRECNELKNQKEQLDLMRAVREAEICESEDISP